jgi:hypothetical protein
MNYPFPTSVDGDRNSLIRKYKKIISKNRNLNFPLKKEDDIMRICSYNVYKFSFLYNSNKEIYKFIQNIDPDFISLIEYHNFPNDNYFFNLNYNKTLLEQSKDYGILSLSNIKPDILNKKYIGNLINIEFEKSGFTHALINDINIITIHLDVFDETGNTRLDEFLEIHTYIVTNALQNVLLIGDFNEMLLDQTHPLYNEYLNEFSKRTGLDKIPNKVHNILNRLNYINLYSLFDCDEIPKFSCWSGKLVDYAFIWKPTWNNNFQIIDLNMPMIPYSDHLPIVIDIKINKSNL